VADYREKIKVTHILIHILWISMNTAMILTIRCTCCNHRMTDDLFCFFSQNKDNYPQVDKIKNFFHRGAASLFLTATGKVVIIYVYYCLILSVKPFDGTDKKRAAWLLYHEEVLEPWKELISLKNASEARNTASVSVWVQKRVKTYCAEEDSKEESNWQHKAALCGLFQSEGKAAGEGCRWIAPRRWKRTKSSDGCTKWANPLQIETWCYIT